MGWMRKPHMRGMPEPCPDTAADLCALSEAVRDNRASAGKRRAILVTGGAGYIGSHTARALHAAGYLPVVLDNFSTGHKSAVRWGPLIEGEVADAALVRRTLREYRIRAVVHLAGSAIVSESMRDPAAYFENNVAATCRLSEAMLQENVDSLVFASSCAVYGIPREKRIREDHPLLPVSPYGASKAQAEAQLAWFAKLCGMRAIVLRYFNA